MQTRYKIFALIAVFALFVMGMAQLFSLRFKAGDIYPPYSSLRADPLGTKAFYESLAALKGIRVIRNYGNEERIAGADKAAFLYLGIHAGVVDAIPEADVRMVEKIAAGGSRIVIAFLPDKSSLTPASDEDVLPGKKAHNADEEAGEDKKLKDEIEEELRTELGEKPKFVSLEERWHFKMDKRADGATEYKAMISGAAPKTLPPATSWHSNRFFRDAGEGWTSIYTAGGSPVVMEKRLGRGSIVLSTDSYFASNEAMVKQRQPALLAWLAGPHKLIVFDETHLGVRENRGVSFLMSQFHFQGLFAGIIILGLLFVWKNSSSLVPPGKEEIGGDEIASEKDYLSGFVNILKRTVTRENLLSVCLAEWKKTARHVRQEFSREKRLEAILATPRSTKQNGIIETYNKARQMTAERGSSNE